MRRSRGSIFPVFFGLLIGRVVILLLTHQGGKLLLFDRAHIGRGGFLVGHQAARGFQPAQQVGLFAQGQHRRHLAAAVAGQRGVDAVKVAEAEVAHYLLQGTRQRAELNPIHNPNRGPVARPVQQLPNQTSERLAGSPAAQRRPGLGGTTLVRTPCHRPELGGGTGAGAAGPDGSLAADRLGSEQPKPPANRRRGRIAAFR